MSSIVQRESPELLAAVLVMEGGMILGAMMVLPAYGLPESVLKKVVGLERPYWARVTGSVAKPWVPAADGTYCPVPCSMKSVVGLMELIASCTAMYRSVRPGRPAAAFH